MKARFLQQRNKVKPCRIVQNLRYRGHEYITHFDDAKSYACGNFYTQLLTKILVSEKWWLFTEP